MLEKRKSIQIDTLEQRTNSRHPIEGAAPATGIAALVDRSRHSHSQLSSVDLLVGGACAGLIAKTLTAPLDRLRIVYQVGPIVNAGWPQVYQVGPKCIPANGGLFHIAAGILREEGPQGFWRGHVATILRVVPFAGVQFLAYEEALTWLCFQYRVEDHAGGWQALALPAAAGASAGALATICTYPLDVLRTRMAAHPDMDLRYRNVASALEEIARNEGTRGFYRGLSPTLFGIMPYAALSFGCFEASKRELARLHGASLDSEVPLAHRLAAGAMSGVVAQLALYPIHLVRRRLQVSSLELGATGSLAYGTTRELVLSIAARDGLPGFWKGASLTWIKGPITVALAFASNDVLKTVIARQHERNEGDQYAPLPGGAYQVAMPGQLKAVESLVCGGCAGAVAKTIIAPADRIKILFQTDISRRFSWSAVLQMAQSIRKEQGVRSFWRGHGATLLRVVPYSATSFATFDPYKQWLRENAPGTVAGDVSVRFIAGAASGTTATILTYPLDMLRARMAADRSCTLHDSYFHVAQRIVREEGVRALWSGLRPTLLGIVPYSGISFGLFETIKANIKDAHNLQSDRDILVWQRLSAGAAAGLVAQSATYPLDVVRRRMQVLPGQYSGTAAALREIARAEGWRGLFKGLSMNWVKGPMAISISFFVNDHMRAHLAPQN